jgi:hypothetical protein
MDLAQVALVAVDITRKWQGPGWLVVLFLLLWVVVATLVVSGLVRGRRRR